MAETKYLYGAAVQGIQSFIFQTNELKDIIGASRLVDEICTKAFEEFKVINNGKPVVNAAGNIKYIFFSREDCEKAVLEFPKKVMKMAPGITISQAVVECNNFEVAVNELEKKLRIQRNRPITPPNLGLMAIQRNPKTGLPAVGMMKDHGMVLVDEATLKKKKAGNETKDELCRKAFGEKVQPQNYPYDIKKITGKNDWIAVIHADGNGLGAIIQGFNKPDSLSNFSLNLDKATSSAAKSAYEYIKSKYQFETNQIVPIRPVVISGDDFTVICRADFAVEYVTEYLRAFEKETENNCGKLTACAGIAFIKSSYPFYYGYNLAEALCDAAKKEAKKIDKKHAPSCLMFHKVQDSFITDYDAIVKRELTPVRGFSWKYGPYYINPDMPEVKDKPQVGKILHCINELKNNKDGNAVKSALREWMTALHKEPAYAEQLLKRAMQVYEDNKDIKNILFDATKPLLIDGNKSYLTYDLLALYAVINQETK